LNLGILRDLTAAPCDRSQISQLSNRQLSDKIRCTDNSLFTGTAEKVLLGLTLLDSRLCGNDDIAFMGITFAVYKSTFNIPFQTSLWINYSNYILPSRPLAISRRLLRSFRRVCGTARKIRFCWARRALAKPIRWRM
jgi:hypothetical protein